MSHPRERRALRGPHLDDLVFHNSTAAQGTSS